MKTYWKSATFQSGAKLEPLSAALPTAFAFSSFLYPLGSSAAFTDWLTEAIDLASDPIGLTVFPTCDLRLCGVPSICRWEFGSCTANSQTLTAHPLTFLVRVFQPLSLGYCDDTYDDSLALTLHSLRLALAPAGGCQRSCFRALHSIAFITY